MSPGILHTDHTEATDSVARSTSYWEEEPQPKGELREVATAGAQTQESRKT